MGVVILIYFIPDQYQTSVVHKKWAYLETALLAIVSGLVYVYNKYLGSQDAYTRLQSVYIATFSKFLVAAGTIAAYVLSDRESFTRPTLFLLMGVYLIFLIFVSAVAIKQSSD